jgi:hypothetical protein
MYSCVAAKLSAVHSRTGSRFCPSAIGESQDNIEWLTDSNHYKVQVQVQVPQLPLIADLVYDKVIAYWVLSHWSLVTGHRSLAVIC